MSSNSKIFTPSELRNQLASEGALAWRSRYDELLAVSDLESGLVDLAERYCSGLWSADGTRALHLPKTSDLVLSAEAHGTVTVYRLQEGEVELFLQPSLAPVGIEKVLIDQKNQEIAITFTGLAGYGVGATYGRGLAQGVKRVIIEEPSGGRSQGKGTIILPRYEQLIISVDDTDNPTEGATIGLVQNIAYSVAEKHPEVRLIRESEVQLYHGTKEKTSNCFGTVVAFAIPSTNEDLYDTITTQFIDSLSQVHFSDDSVMCTFRGIAIPEPIIIYGLRAKATYVKDDFNDLATLAKENKVNVYSIHKQRANGIKGALASLAFYDNPKLAAELHGV